jgi:hypothetical protein
MLISLKTKLAIVVSNQFVFPVKGKYCNFSDKALQHWGFQSICFPREGKVDFADRVTRGFNKDVSNQFVFPVKGKYHLAAGSTARYTLFPINLFSP